MNSKFALRGFLNTRNVNSSSHYILTIVDGSYNITIENKSSSINIHNELTDKNNALIKLGRLIQALRITLQNLEQHINLTQYDVGLNVETFLNVKAHRRAYFFSCVTKQMLVIEMADCHNVVRIEYPIFTPDQIEETKRVVDKLLEPLEKLFFEVKSIYEQLDEKGIEELNGKPVQTMGRLNRTRQGRKPAVKYIKKFGTKYNTIGWIVEQGGNIVNLPANIFEYEFSIHERNFKIVKTPHRWLTYGIIELKSEQALNP